MFYGGPASLELHILLQPKFILDSEANANPGSFGGTPTAMLSHRDEVRGNMLSAGSMTLACLFPFYS